MQAFYLNQEPSTHLNYQSRSGWLKSVPRKMGYYTVPDRGQEQF